MNYLKQGGKIGIFFIACAITFGFSNEKAFSAPTTRDDCLTYVSKTAQCKNSCSGLTQIGTCSDDTSGNTLCCDKVYKEGDKCGTGDIGTCREYKGSGKTCTGSEVDIGACSGTTTTGATLRCCSSSDSVSTSDDSCKKVGGVCIPDSGDAGGGCLQDGKTIGTKIGTCNKKAGSDNAQNCCKSSSSTDSSTLSSSGSGASLKYTPLENLPGFENQGGDFAAYFGNLYKLALWIVGISALFMLVVGGFLYLSSAGNTALLGTAKKTIYSALIGLVIALVSWLLLDTINSDLTNLKLSGLSGAISSGSSSGTTEGTSGSSSTPTEYKGKGSGCSGAETQGAKVHCEDASQDLSDTLYCMVDKLKASGKKIQISSISEDSGGKSLFTQCRDNWTQPPCEHGKGSCHYGGSVKNDKSCAADISGSYINGGGSAASASEVKDVAGKCGAQINDEMGKSSGAHIHVSVKGCGCL